LMNVQSLSNMRVHPMGVNEPAPGGRSRVERFDLIVIGGGIVGLATAREWLLRRPGSRLLLLEKEDALGRHQSSRNSGVIHAGVYYRPGSLKAVNCRAGRALMETFCTEEGIHWERCGKVIVATGEEELPRLRGLYERATANGVDCEEIGPERLHELEPHAAGVAALHVPETGITDFALVCDRLARRVNEAGGEIRVGTRVTGMRFIGGDRVVETSAGVFTGAAVVNCAGLYTDRVALMGGEEPGARIIPFRGEYYALRPEARTRVNTLIYPVPDPRFPFLGVHFTRTIDGGVECGPNAVLAFAREGYRKRDIVPAELLAALTWPGFLRLIPRYGRTGLGEIARSLSKRAFVTALQRLVPDIVAEHLEPAPAGVRAQAIRRDGTVLDDFVFLDGDRVVHVINAPSPAATASLNIARHVVERLERLGD